MYTEGKGVDTSTPPVDAFATRIKGFDRQNFVLIA